MDLILTLSGKDSRKTMTPGVLVLAVCLLSILSCALVLSASYMLPEAAYTSVSVRHLSVAALKAKKKQGGESSDSCLTSAIDCGGCSMCDGCDVSDACSGCDVISCDCTL